MKRKTFAAILLLASTVRAGSVLWNTDVGLGYLGAADNFTEWSCYLAHFVWEDGEYGYVGGGQAWGVKIEPDGAYWGNNFEFRVEPSEVGSLRYLTGSTLDIGRYITVLSAEPGDVIDAAAAADASRRLLTNHEGGDGISIPYAGDKQTSIYLGIEAGMEFRDYPYFYGWMELIADDMTLRLGDTCLDLTGRPVVVGVRSAEPIPEPATGALALAGAALLFRRRPRRSSPTLRAAERALAAQIAPKVREHGFLR